MQKHVKNNRTYGGEIGLGHTTQILCSHKQSTNKKKQKNKTEIGTWRANLGHSDCSQHRWRITPRSLKCSKIIEQPVNGSQGLDTRKEE